MLHLDCFGMILVKKSECNLESAEKLISYELYASSVHCSYYSCFQAVVSYYLIKTKKDYSSVKLDIKDNNKHTHTYFIDKICGIHLNTSKNPNRSRESKTLKDLYKNLKTLRVVADYDNEEISKSTAIKAFSNCNEFNNLLKKLV